MGTSKDLRPARLELPILRGYQLVRRSILLSVACFSDIRLRRRYRASWQATYGNRQSERIDRLIGARVRLFPPLLVQSFYRGPSSHQKRQKRTLLFAERVSELIRLALAHYKFVLSIPKPFADVSRLIYQMILTFY